MKRFLVSLAIVIGFIIAVVLTLFLVWTSQEKREMNVYILNKSVINSSTAEHKTFVWLLNHNRFVPPHRSYSYKQDYYGFFPVDPNSEIFDFRSIRISDVDLFASTFDMAYYVDCYGVYSFEWYKGKSKPIRSQRVYGGLNQNDYLLMKKMLEQGKLVIGEYNMFGSPTNALVRSKTEALMNVGWTGWSGKYYDSFDVNEPDGPPQWMKNLYESQHMGAWPRNGSGIILLSNDGMLEVLELGEHLNSKFPTIRMEPDAAKRFGINRAVPFNQWFEFIDAGENHVPASFNLDVSDNGAQVLRNIGLNHTFPAVIEHSDANMRLFYFCGNFAHNPVQMWTAKLATGKKINNFLYRYRIADRASFLNDFYFPLLEGIMEEYWELKSRNGL